MLKRETSVNNSIMVTQAKLHIIYWPIGILSNAMIDNIYPVAEFLTPYFCTALSFFVNFSAISVILYSFYACLLRYLCCLHTEKVKKFGKTKMIGILYWVFYAHVFIWALSTVFTSFNSDRLPMINKCYGWQARVYLLELDDTANMMKRHFCALNSSDGK